MIGTANGRDDVRGVGAIGQSREDSLTSSCSIRTAAIMMSCTLLSQMAAGQEKAAIMHTPLLQQAIPRAEGREVTVWDTEYAPGAINPRHLHPAAITFHVLSGTGIWQEDGKPPVTLHAGDTLFVGAGTIHAHWNPSATERLRFLEFIVAESGKGRSIPQPPAK